MILFHDSVLVAVHKPSGLLVHRTRLAASEDRCMMAELRDQIGQWVYPVHRLDRSASGVLLFALQPETASAVAEQFRKHSVKKTYLAAVRGWPKEQGNEEGRIDKPLRAREDAEYAPAVSHYRVLSRVELPVATGRYSTSRLSIVRVRTETGRMHQVRKHLTSISHPILGDTVYGDGRYNRMIRERFGVHRLLLLGESLELEHPVSGMRIQLETKPEAEFESVCGRVAENA